MTDAMDHSALNQSRHRAIRVRQEGRRRILSVTTVERVTPAMARITFAGADLADFSSPGHDDHLKLFFPGQTPADEAHKRDYTPRRFDAAKRELVIDFVLHDGGPATSWAMTASVGDVLEIAGPRGSTVVPDDFDWYLLVGDASALPAIGRRVEELRPGVPAMTVVVVNDPQEVQQIETAADWRAHWVHRSQEDGDDTASLLRVLVGMDFPEGDGYIWIAAEAQVARALRRHMLERGHPHVWLKASGYWVRGHAGAHENFKGDEPLGEERAG